MAVDGGKRTLLKPCDNADRVQANDEMGPQKKDDERRNNSADCHAHTPDFSRVVRLPLHGKAELPGLERDFLFGRQVNTKNEE
jgi:hypothetical protein